MRLLQAGRLALLLPFVCVEAVVYCGGSFSEISAADYVARINPGWNLGNTLDATPNEGSWNNPPVVPDTFDDVKKAGYKSVRLPVTWTSKIGPPPTYVVDPKWLDRVSMVVSQITSRGLYAIVNVHHDSWQWFDFSAPGANVTALEEKFSKLWFQIGTKLACASSLVAFEPINEPKGTTREHGDIMNHMNSVFLKAINDAGGWNPKRVVTLVGLGEDGPKTSKWFKPPTGFSNPWALQYHYYSPYDFVFSAWGKTIWGSPADQQSLETDIRLVRQNFTNIPLIIGEWASSPTTTEPAARWKWTDSFVRAATKYNTSIILWDNGDDFLDRQSHTWRDETLQQVLMEAFAGAKNSLPDSTEDPSAKLQCSGAFIFHKSKEQLASKSLPFLLNGNIVTKIVGPKGPLSSPADYSVSSPSADGKANITFTANFLGKYVSQVALPGNKSSLTVSFSAGADVQIQVIQWDVPTFSDNAPKTSKAVGGNDLKIPITWKGIPKVAAVRAVYNDGSYLVDEFTKWFGPLQAGYATYNNHWNWDAKNVILKANAVNAVISSRKEATFTFDFFPRVPGNSINYTLTI